MNCCVISHTDGTTLETGSMEEMVICTEDTTGFKIYKGCWLINS